MIHGAGGTANVFRDAPVAVFLPILFSFGRTQKHVWPEECHSRGRDPQEAGSSLPAFWRVRQAENREFSKKSARGARKLCQKPVPVSKVGLTTGPSGGAGPSTTPQQGVAHLRARLFCIAVAGSSLRAWRVGDSGHLNHHAHFSVLVACDTIRRCWPSFRRCCPPSARRAGEARPLSDCSCRRAGLSCAMISFVERTLRNASRKTLPRIACVPEVDHGEVIPRATQAAPKQQKPIRSSP